jgi:4a-hydroxytetrahydrobiopterin dehydratase
MTTLADQSCVPCLGSDPPLKPPVMEKMRAQVPTWHIVKENKMPRLRRFYEFPDFKGAFAFSQQIAEQADKAGHHPVLITEWGKVTVIWWTPIVHGLHQNDFVMAAKTDALYNHY